MPGTGRPTKEPRHSSPVRPAAQPAEGSPPQERSPVFPGDQRLENPGGGGGPLSPTAAASVIVTTYSALQSNSGAKEAETIKFDKGFPQDGGL